MKKIDNNFRFLIVGGGTAGWLSALFFKRYFPESDVTLVESTEIGILGAGEGTTPHFFDFIKELDIDITDLIIESDATFKNGIKFTNWNETEGHYYHPFKDYGKLDVMKYSMINFCNQPLMALELISKRQNLDAYSFTARCSEENKVRYINVEGSIEPIGSHALHFNAKKLADFLSKTAQNRGIRKVEGKVDGGIYDDRKNIKSVILENRTILSCDFLIDCTGFGRKFIGKDYETRWKSYKEYLTVNCAIPFFIDHDNKNIPPYTESIAMDYGWMWKIPVIDRFGCGYVFDTGLISREKALRELENFLETKIHSLKTFEFEAGHYIEPWKNNVLAVGLAAGFIEPLEATSIWTTIQQLHLFLEHVDAVCFDEKTSIDTYNNEFCQINRDIFNFVYFHYLGSRNSSKFWNKFKDNENHPPDIQELINKLEETVPNWRYWDKKRRFTLESWFHVIQGLEKFDSTKSGKLFDAICQGLTKTGFNRTKENFYKDVEKFASLVYDHTEMLFKIRNITR